MSGDGEFRNAEVTHHEMRQLRNDVRELSNQVHDLVEAWNTARGLVRFVKTIGSIATAGAAIWVLLSMIWERK